MSTAIFDPGRSVAPPGAVVTLKSPAALDPEVAGAKAASLARSLRAGLPVLPGWVLTTAASGGLPVDAELRAAWADASDGGRRPVVVRSSSTVEDGRTSSMAGMFTSVLDVHDWLSFRQAVDTVLASANVVALADAGARQRARAPMAVLIQPQLDAAVGGVLFGVDPVTGRTDHVVVSASEAGPAAVVGGQVDGSRYVLSRRRVVDGPAGGPLTPGRLRQLRGLAHRAERVFGGPQDVEWAFDAGGRLWLLQSRPVTAVGVSRTTGPTLGPGPVAETFPEPLSPLEEDLWVEPLRAGLRAALALAGTTPKRRLTASPVVTTVDGRVAADLDLLVGGDAPSSTLRRLDPRPSIRRLIAAWRVGRLRAALPALASDLVARVDADLLAVEPLARLSDRQLLGLLDRSAPGLTALHGYEVLLGWLVTPDATAASTTGAAVALRDLAAGRSAGLRDDELVRRYPSVLALVAPRIAPAVVLPPTAVAPPAPEGEPHQAAVLREALRLRARWLQELTARAAWELGARLATRGTVAGPGDVRWLRRPELDEAVRTGAVPADALARAAGGGAGGAPLPARFRLTIAGTVAPASRPEGRRHGRHARSAPGTRRGSGAGGGRGSGIVHAGDGPPDPGAVLVVRTLDPDLAPLLPRLGGLVSETGSFLSHLAILAREYGVPTAVGVEDALARFPAGARVLVDGTTGEVAVLDDHGTGAA